MAQKTITENQNELKNKLKEPNMYKVILLNDDYTTMEFVVEILVTIFHKTPTESTKIMLDVHEKGKGVVDIYTFDIASTKIAKVDEVAKKEEYPLIAIMEQV